MLSGVLPAAPEGATEAIRVNFSDENDYSNSSSGDGGLFRDLLGGEQISRGSDVFGSRNNALNFNNCVDGLTLYDETPGDESATLFSGSIDVSLDVILSGTKQDSAGVVVLYNEETGKGLALVLRESGSTDRLRLCLMENVGGQVKLTQLMSVNLKNDIRDGMWYQLTFELEIEGDALTVKGRAFRHADPYGERGSKLRKNLYYTGSLSGLGLSDSGQVGLLLEGGNSKSKASFTHMKVTGNKVDPVSSPEPDPGSSVEIVAGSEIRGSLVSPSGVLQLLVLGTDSDDVITLSQVTGGLQLTTPTGMETFLGEISSMVLYGFGGNDILRLTSSVTISSVLYGGLGNDQLFDAGTGSGILYGQEGDDLLVSVGGGTDAVTGGAGFDSFWVDSSDVIRDASVSETAGTAVHRISAFLQPTDEPGEAVSLEVAGQEIVDPEAALGYRDYSGWTLFADGAEYTDIDQGSVGDCYFLAALAALSYTDASLVEQMIAPLGDGSYAVRFYRYGEEVYVRVDGDLPSSGGSSLYYAKLTPDGETWVALMEKAYAQFRYGLNSYDSISGGSRATALSELTGASVQVRSMSGTQEQVATYIMSNLSAGHAVTAGTSSHAYMVKGVENVSGTWYVDLYNPWGFVERVTMTNFQTNWVNGFAVCLV